MPPVSGWVIASIVLSVVSVAYAIFGPKPKVPDATVQTGQAPTAQEGRPIPVVFGTVLVRDPNIVYYGDLYTRPIKSSGGKK